EGTRMMIADHEGEGPEAWQKMLDDFAKSSLGDLKKRGLAILVLEEGDRIAWRSETDVPPWPMRNRSDWEWALAKAPPGYLIVVAWPKHTDWRASIYEGWGLWGLSAVILLVAGFGAWLLVGHTLMPIRMLARQASTATADDLRLRLTPPSQDAE